MGNETLQEIVQRAAIDLDFRRRLVRNPREVLSEKGFSIPREKKVSILENTDDMIYVVIPPLQQEEKPGVVSLNFKVEGKSVSLEGTLDSYSVDMIRETLLEWEGNLTLDLKDLIYISSAGLALLLNVQKKLKESGYKLRIIHLMYLLY